MRRALGAGWLLLLVCEGCSGMRTPAAPDPGGASGTPVRVLMLTATAGFRHDAIGTARQALAAAAASAGDITITPTEDLSAIARGPLGAYDVLMFALTTGELPFSGDQKAAILEFVNGGKGFIGVHSATDTLYEWPEYGRMIGAYFKEHPWAQTATVVVEDESHPAASGLGRSFQLLEEFYTFRENPRPHVQVLLRLDERSVGAAGDYPLAWTSSTGAGRVYYNALGHFSSTWTDVRFQRSCWARSGGRRAASVGTDHAPAAHSPLTIANLRRCS
jgi:type 1 glutamine amidotransferase